MTTYKWVAAFRNRLKNTGNVPNTVFNDYLDQYTSVKQITPLLLSFKSKKRNIDLIQKIYWWILTTLTVGIIASGIISLRTLNLYYNAIFSTLFGNWVIFILVYLLLMGTIEMIIQFKKNSIYNNLQLINDRVESLKKNDQNMAEKQLD